MTIRRNAEARVAEFDIRPTSVTAPAGTLSGGNQQKVVLAREMSRPLRLLIASQPTRGVDVGAQEFIHRRIVAERDRGTPVVIVSTELDEVLALADRIAVMYRGKIIGELPGGSSRDEVGLMMAGVPAEKAARGGRDPPERADDLRAGGSEVTAVLDTPPAPAPAPKAPPASPRPARGDSWLVTCWRSCWRWSSAAS